MQLFAEFPETYEGDRNEASHRRVLRAKIMQNPYCVEGRKYTAENDRLRRLIEGPLSTHDS